MRKIIKIFFLTAIIALNYTGFAQKNKNQKPNILFIVVDDLKPIIGAYGNTEIKSPNIDKLAESGIKFENAYCQQAVCAASRISAFTGMRPDRTKVTDLHTNMRDMNPDIVTMPQFFKSKGYETVGFGKLMHGAKKNDPRSWTIPYEEDDQLTYAKGYKVPVFGHYQNPEAQKLFDTINTAGFKRKQYVKLLRSNNLLLSTECIDVPDNAYEDGAIAEAAIKQLKKFKNDSKPFFLALGFHKPHLPFVAPQKYWDLYERDKMNLAEFRQHAENSPKFAYHNWGELRKYSDIPAKGSLDTAKQKELIHGYWASISYVDAQIGKVLKELKKLGLDKNTIIVLWGDHGWHLGDHGLWCKHTNFEQATKVPFIISAPGYKKDKKAETMAEMVDIFPTLVEYAGFKIPENLEGNSLIPVLNKPEKEIKDYAISQYPRGNNIMGYSLRTKRYRLTLWLKGDFKHEDLYRNPDIAAIELYDYQNDPLEKISQAENPEYAKIVKELKDKLLHLLVSESDIQKNLNN